jgi:hypothetical protein
MSKGQLVPRGGAASTVVVALALAGTALLASTASAAPLAGPPGRNAAAAWQQECGSCHVPFPVKRLSAADWERLIGDLEHHFGDDATLDPALTAALARYAGEQAGSARKYARPNPDAAPRITATTWFARKHRNVPPTTWQSAVVRQPTNCGACHDGAADGHFSGHHVHLPR